MLKVKGLMVRVFSGIRRPLQGVGCRFLEGCDFKTSWCFRLQSFRV